MPKSPSEALSPELLAEFDRTFHRIFKRTASIAPGARAIELTEDVRLEAWRATVHKGVYFIPDAEAEACDGTRDLVLYAMDFADPSTVTVVEGLMDQGKARQGGTSAQSEFPRPNDRADRETCDSTDNSTNDAPTSENFSVEERSKQDALKPSPNHASVTFDAGVKAIGVSFKPLRVSSREQPFGVHEIAVWATYADLRRRHKRAMAEALLEQSYTPTTVATEPISEDLPRQDLIKLRTAHYGKSKVTEQLTTTIWSEERAVGVGGKTERGVDVFYRIDDETGIRSTKPIEPFDVSVITIVGSMYRAGVEVTSDSQIAKAMCGKRASPKLVSLVHDSMDKMFTSLLVADMTEEAKAHGVHVGDLPAEKTTYKGHVVDAQSITAVNAKGERETMWYLLSEPWFFAHDLATKNITAVPAKLLEDVAAKVRMDGDAVVIRDYLIRRIKWMERTRRVATRRVATRVRYQAIQDNLEKSDLSKKQQRAIREKALEIAKGLAASDALPNVIGVREYSMRSAAGRQTKTGIDFIFRDREGCKKS